MFSTLPLGFIMDSYTEYSPSDLKGFSWAGPVTYRGMVDEKFYDYCD